MGDHSGEDERLRNLDCCATDDLLSRAESGVSTSLSLHRPLVVGISDDASFSQEAILESEGINLLKTRVIVAPRRWDRKATEVEPGSDLETRSGEGVRAGVLVDDRRRLGRDSCPSKRTVQRSLNGFANGDCASLKTGTHSTIVET